MRYRIVVYSDRQAFNDAQRDAAPEGGIICNSWVNLPSLGNVMILWAYRE